ncbi:neuronal acetylcholine receptor subunit alpha-7 [Plakobranchus ocellatus]|uniref:Neuronal acetylcholine receptor subunit alpha-7 n=1 Tax=Plakobranchus ocellatus TaxID=259542 RepID=A0AAV4A7Y0_9GAST|nr:neuronal acetylcholine receptor subunit alpha-7 [Plakobranchus ocellatus]
MPFSSFKFVGYSATVDDVAKLHSDLFSNYKRVIPPVYQQNHAVQVRLSLFLLMIHDLNWEDEFLRWNKSDYGGVEEITVSQASVWLPDILVENTAQHFAEIGSDSILVSIKDNGHISWEPGILTKTICEVNIGKYPFDYQKCEIKFLTWMHTNKTLDVQPGSDLVSLDATISNGEWDIKSAVARPYFYPSTYKIGTAHTGVKFVIELMRKRTFYVLNTIIPVVMLSLLNVLVFLLPASSGEKMALAVTVLLSFTVYLSIISEVMPKTSESISILAVYLTSLLSLSTMSVLSSGVVMNMIHQDDDKPVPEFLRCLVCCRRRQIRREVTQGKYRRRLPPGNAEHKSVAGLGLVSSQSSNFSTSSLRRQHARNSSLKYQNFHQRRKNSQDGFDHRPYAQDQYSGRTVSYTITNAGGSGSDSASTAHPSLNHGWSNGDTSRNLPYSASPPFEANIIGDRESNGEKSLSSQISPEKDIKYNTGKFREPVVRYEPKADGKDEHCDITDEEHEEREALFERPSVRLSKQSDDLDPDDWSLVTWMDVGSAVDTILFWVFLGITVTSTAVVLILFSAQ